MFNHHVLGRSSRIPAVDERRCRQPICFRRISLPLLLICLLPGGAPGQTINARRVWGRYQQFVWMDQHGVLESSIYAIARTRDGYLWIGTVEGLVRFDGVRFTVFDSNNTPEIKGNLIISLLADRAGNLWIGTQSSGLLRYAGGRFTRYTTADGLAPGNVWAVLEDRAGNLWIGTDSGLYGLRDGHLFLFTPGAGLPANQVRALAEDVTGKLWIGTRSGLTCFDQGRFTSYTVQDGMAHNEVWALHADRDGTLWVGTAGGLSRWREGRFTHTDLPSGLLRVTVRTLQPGRAGDLWIGTRGHGIFCYRQGRFDSYTSKDGLPFDDVVSIYPDPEGDIWIGTYGGGMAQLREGHLRTYTTQDGLPEDEVRAVYGDSRGRLWMQTGNALSRFQDGLFTIYTAKDGVPPGGVSGIGEDMVGNVWFGSRQGLYRFKDGRAVGIAPAGFPKESVDLVFGDRAGNVWFSSSSGGLHQWRDGRLTSYAARDGLFAGEVRSLYEDRAGNLWIGGSEGRLSRFKDGRFTTWTPQDGLANLEILSFYEDYAGGLWIGTHGGGLYRFKHGNFAVIRVKDGLYDNLAFQILPDAPDAEDGGNLWMSCNKGIYRASLRELNEFADGRRMIVNSFAYSLADGMLSYGCNGAQPAGARTRDGRLWFPTVKGVVAVDPRPTSSEPPLVAIEEALLDRAPLPPGQQVLIRPGQDNLEIRYTGLSWRRPQQLHFKYQLVGLDRDWVDAGLRRTAYYSYLPPGGYTFRVIADNGEGVWNTEGRSLRITVLAPFYRRPWFLLLLSLLIVGLAMGAVRLRFNQLRKARQAQEQFSRQLLASQEQERQRIAAELHDSLGQSLLVIKNRVLLALNRLADPAATKEQLDEISASTSHAIRETREIAYNLRPYQLERFGLTKTLRGICAQAEASSHIQFSAELEVIDGLLPQEAEINLYRIVQEGINNIIKHSGATEAKLTIRQHATRVSVWLEDNGRGFAPPERNTRSAGRLNVGAQVEAATAPKGGFGLIGIAERARMLGGVYTIDSQPGRGTLIRIEIPLKEKKKV